MQLDVERIQKSIQRVRKFLAHVPKDPETVHDLRTSARRLEATVQTPGLDSKRRNKQLLRNLAQLRKHAGKVRDIDVFTYNVLKLPRLESKEKNCPSGVSIGFNPESFRPPKNFGILARFAPCVYDTATQKELVESTLKPFREEVEGNLDKIHKSGPDAGSPATQFYKSAASLFTDLWTIAALSKDPSFREEEEWRLVLPFQADRQPPPNTPPSFRIGKTTVIPYITHPYPPVKPLPIVDVILGPGSHENAVEATEAFLKSNGINVKPRLSAVPYRSA